MKITRTVYYVTYTQAIDELPRYSTLFATEQAARTEAVKPARQGY